MVNVTFVSTSRGARGVQAQPGDVLLNIALAANIAGIIGDCGGELSCGTCHVYVDEAFLALLPKPSEDEQVMIDDGVIDPKPNSRLCCQIRLTSALDGLLVTVGANG